MNHLSGSVRTYMHLSCFLAILDLHRHNFFIFSAKYTSDNIDGENETNYTIVWSGIISEVWVELMYITINHDSWAR